MTVYPPVVLLLCTLLLTAPAAEHGTEALSLTDPADALAEKIKTLSTQDQQLCRKLFRQLSSEDYELREAALSTLVAKGPAVLTIAAEFHQDADGEVANHARGMPERIVLNYEGFLPSDPKLAAALRQPVRVKNSAMLSLEGAAEQLGIRLKRLSTTAGERNGFSAPEQGYRCGRDLLDYCAASEGLRGVPRGAFFVVGTPEQAARLRLQRHAFEWSELQLSRKEAERVGAAFQRLAPSSELHPSGETLLARGDEQTLRRIARLLALLKPEAPDAVFPVPQLGLDPRAVTEVLSRKVSLSLAAEDPLALVAKLKAQGLDVFVARDIDDSDPRQEAPFPEQAQGGSPMRLKLDDLPAGLLLRWFERRAKLTGVTQDGLALRFELGPQQRLQLRVQPRQVEAEHLCGADVSFLYSAAAQLGPESDQAAQARLLDVLEPHLAIYPSQARADMVVLRGRFLMQGPPASLTQALALIREWRLRGEPPPPPAWRRELNAVLATPIDWNGRDADGRVLTVARLLPTLKRLGRINLLLEDAADGTAAALEIQPGDAGLLPPGKYSLRTLLDELAAKAQAQWRVELGVIVLSPKPKHGK